MSIEVHAIRPTDFKKTFEASACYLESEGTLLLLQQSSKTNDKGRWGVPAGKIKACEHPQQAALRELFEETGIGVEHASKLQSLGYVYIKDSRGHYVFHIFHMNFLQKPPIHLSDEHQSYQWIERSRVIDMPLRAGACEVFQYYQNLLEIKSHPTAHNPGISIKC